jgi:hypothetical protein
MLNRNNNSTSAMPGSIANCLIFLLSLLTLCPAAYSQSAPYIADINGEDDIRTLESWEAEDALRLLGTFKVFNPDTIPFYIWVSFESGGKMTHAKYGKEFPSIQLVDLELRYKNTREQPMVKKFPNNGSDFRVKRRFGGAWLGGGRSGKRVPRGKAVDEDVEAEAGVVTGRSNRGREASEIAFWKEDAQGYYEMELWGALYAPDIEKATVAGRYVENIKFEIEPMK